MARRNETGYPEAGKLDYNAAAIRLKTLITRIYLIGVAIFLVVGIVYVASGRRSWVFFITDFLIFLVAALVVALFSYRLGRRTISKIYVSERQLHSITDVSSDAVYSIDSDSLITAWSKGAERIFGYSEEEAVGQSLAITLPDDFIERDFGILEPLLRDGVVMGHRTLCRRRNGDVFHSEASISLLKTPEGEPSGLLTVLRDITGQVEMEAELHEARDELEMRIEERTAELKETNRLLQREIAGRIRMEAALQKREEHFRALIESAQDIIFVITEDGTVDFVSPSVERVFGYNPQEVLGRTIFSFIHSEDLPRIKENFEFMLRNPELVVSAQCRVRAKDGSWLWFDNMGTNLLDDPSVGAIVLNSRDITERVRFGMELWTLNRELEAFSYSVSHDLRAPLRTIAYFSRALMDEHGKNLDSEGMRFLEIIRDNTEQMDMLIKDLLTFSRAGRQELRFSSIDMEELVNEVKTDLQVELGERSCDFEIGALPQARGDRSLIRQVFANLLANSIKFTAGKEPALVEVGSLSEDDETIFFVRDNGVGFDMKYAEKLFAVFQRLHSADEFDGTGVGLAIVQRIINRHGGRVWGEGRVGEGATFYFSLPRSEGGRGEEV